MPITTHGQRATRLLSKVTRNIDLSQPTITAQTVTCHIAAGLCVLASFGPAFAQEPSNESPSHVIQNLRSTHFNLTTDLSATEGQECLKRMEQVLSLAEGYWSRALPGQIRCYVVSDLERWSKKDFPVAAAHRILRQVRGGTDLPAPSRRNSRTPQAVIYAMAEPGVAEHEVVHAYCFQTFGQGGPDWYREGMAELFSQEIDRSIRGNLRAESIGRLRANDPPTLHRVIRSGKLQQSLADLLAASPGQIDPPAASTDRHGPEGQNQAQHDRLSRARTAYAESWALCHLLYHSQNYRDRFQLLGKHFLAGAPIKMEDAFAGRLEEINFELAQFTEHVSAGYRVDLCNWDWTHRCRTLDVGRSITVRLRACRGFQPTQIQLEPGHEYAISAQGTWRTAVDGPSTDANGDQLGCGRLEAVVYDQFALAEPVAIGKIATWTADQSGTLFLRCCDAWDQLADNRGTIVVRLTRVR